MHKQENVVRKLKKARTLIISKENLELLGKQFSFDDYNEFYAKHFAPLRLPSDNLLSEPYDYGDSEETDLKDAFEQNKTGGNEDMEDGFIIDNGGAGSPEDDGFELPDEESYDNKQGEPGNNVISVPEGPQGQGGIPDEDDVPTIPTDDDGFTIPTDDDGFTIPTDDDGFTIPTDDDGFTIPTDDDGYTIPTDGNEINNSVVKPNSNNNSVEDNEYNLFESKRNPNSGKVPTKTDTKNNQKKVELPTDATPTKTGQNNRSSQSNRNNQSNRSNRSKQDAKNPEKPAEKPAKKPDPDPATIIPEDDDGFYFDIDPEPTSPTPKKKEKELQDIDLEDEYYDLDGF